MQKTCRRCRVCDSAADTRSSRARPDPINVLAESRVSVAPPIVRMPSSMSVRDLGVNQRTSGCVGSVSRTCDTSFPDGAQTSHRVCVRMRSGSSFRRSSSSTQYRLWPRRSRSPTATSTSRGVIRSVAIALRTTTGLFLTSDGKSHSWVIPTS